MGWVGGGRPMREGRSWRGDPSGNGLGMTGPSQGPRALLGPHIQDSDEKQSPKVGERSRQCRGTQTLAFAPCCLEKHKTSR